LWSVLEHPKHQQWLSLQCVWPIPCPSPFVSSSDPRFPQYTGNCLGDILMVFHHPIKNHWFLVIMQLHSSSISMIKIIWHCIVLPL
jgi:hypothetical protein